MIRTMMAAALAAMVTLPAAAQDFSANSEAKGWNNLEGREPARFTGKVVDVLCELTGDCTETCGDGRRQMGIVREADGKLILVGKNNQASFNGGAVDMAAFCNQLVEVDGLMVGNPDLTPTKYFQVQLIMGEGRDKFTPAKRWTRVWERNNPDADGKGPWFRRDPSVNAQIEENGWLGLGHEADKVFIEEFY